LIDDWLLLLLLMMLLLLLLLLLFFAAAEHKDTANAMGKWPHDFGSE